MRLLAYGGTAYAERQRIGAWENTPRAALDDSFRLDEERSTFGLCLIENDPVLVIRRLQITRTGREYAYSLLLDPGLEIWLKFDWDAAALAHELFNAGPDISTLLWEQPEKLNAQELDKILANVSEKAAQSVKKQPNGITDREAAWIGGFFTPAASSLPPQVLDFPARPTFAETSDLIHRLPPCFRAGMGWLIGSSSQSARSFGARLSIDERADSDSNTQFVELGHRLYNALQTLANNDDDEFAEIGNRLATKPAWDWSPEATKDAAILADRLILVASLIKFSPDQDDLLDQAIVTLPQTEFLQKELRRAWQRAVISAQKKLTETQTSFALENLFDHSLPLPNDEFLDPSTLAERFVTDERQPSDPGIPQLSLPLRRTVWGLYLQKSQNDDLPQTFFNAIDDLEDTDGEQAADHVSALTKELGERMSRDKSLNLLFWKDHDRHRHWPTTRELLCDVSMQRARSGNIGWEIEYLLFADDDGGEKLSQANIPQKQLREMIDNFVNMARDRRGYPGEAIRWLQALGNSSLRTSGLLTCEKKYLISLIAVTHTWVKYTDLYDFYVNKTATSLDPPVATGEDRTILLNELEELIRQKPAHDFAPNVHGLQIMLGPLPESIMRSFQGLSPKFSNSADAHKWVQAWETIDPARASREELRALLVVESDITNDYWLKPEFEEKHLKTLLVTLMFYAHPNLNELYKRRWGYVLRQAVERNANRVLNLIKEIFREGIEKPEQAKIFCERCGKDRETLRVMFKVLPKTTSGLALTDALYRTTGDYFVKEAQKAWDKAQKNNISSYERALLYHLSKRKEARTQVVRRLEDDRPGERIKLGLDEILKQDSDPGAQDQQDDDVPVTKTTENLQSNDDDVADDEEESQSVLESIKGFLGFGSARKQSKDRPRRGEILGISPTKRNSGKQKNASKDGD
ncbi:MAG TPA: hypothetical protein VE980_15005 [Pyrinomonadaceae bacterium]|nr:hypothetical protein [Pyrinomonadaceae bacterium]